MNGVIALDKYTLAPEPNTGDAMLADISMAVTETFQFLMVGADASDEALTFRNK